MALGVQKKYRLEEGATLFAVGALNCALLFFADLTKAYSVFFLNLSLAVIIITVSLAHRKWHGRLLAILRDWYPLPLLITIYLELETVIPLVNPQDMDYLLIKLDRMIFLGHDPTVLMESITFPPVTEFLQIVYASFYLLPVTLCFMIYINGRREVFHTVASAIIIGFYISYAGYFLTPAIGPRYTLSHLQNTELVGLWSFGYLRSMLDNASGIMRDCCPSGHTMISLVTVFLAWRYERRFTPVALMWAVLLVFSTVYLRYHYMVDLLAGIVLALIFSLAFPAIERYRSFTGASYRISFSKIR